MPSTAPKVHAKQLVIDRFHLNDNCTLSGKLVVESARVSAQRIYVNDVESEGKSGQSSLSD